MITDRYLFIEPTIGIPIQPMLAKKIIASSEYDAIIWLQQRNFSDNSCEYFENLIGEKLYYLDDMISKTKVNGFKEQAIEITAKSLKKIGNECQGLHTITFNEVPIGLYIVSFLQRHNTELCKHWSIPKQQIKNTLTSWYYFGLIVKYLAQKNPGLSSGMFTHHVYFYGFISELLHYHGVKSITFGAADVPLFKPGLTKYNPYSWSMGSYCQHALKVPSSFYEYSQPIANVANDYISFIKSSCKRKVPDSLYDSIVSASSYKELETFLVKKNIKIWKKSSDFTLSDEDEPNFCLYLHSFSDSTFTYEYDNFDTLMDYYLQISLALVKLYPGAYFYIRPHPNVFSPLFNDRIKRDIELTIYFISQLLDHIENLVFICPTVSNNSFYELSEKSVAITHHSPSMALETSFANRLIITSRSTIKIKLESPLILSVSKDSLDDDLNQLNSKLVNKPNLSTYDKIYLISRSVPKLFYNPVYQNKILRSKHIPALLAGYSDFHKDFCPDLSKKAEVCSFSGYEDFESFILKNIGTTSFKYLLKEILYAKNLLSNSPLK